MTSHPSFNAPCDVPRVRRLAVASSLVLLLLAPSVSSAQMVQSFDDLALRVNLGDRVHVEGTSGPAATGRLVRLTHDEMTIQTSAGERRYTRDDVREVRVGGHPLGKTALVGAVVLATLGAVTVCSREGAGGSCVAAPFGVAPVGAGFGLAIGGLISSMKAVYRAPEGRAPLAGAPAARGERASLLEDLALRVNLDDSVRVEDRSGGRTTGRLTRVTADEIEIQAADGAKHFTRESIRQVAVRRRPIRAAVLIGAGAGVATAVVAACAGSDREACEDSPILGGAVGAALGLAVGALIHRTTVVYPETGTQALLLPAISRHAAGVRVSLQW